MADAKIDGNGVRTGLGVLNTNGTTLMRLYADPTNGALKVHDASTGTYPGGNTDKRDGNFTPSITVVSSSDATTVQKLLINSSNQLLIDSN